MNDTEMSDSCKEIVYLLKTKSTPTDTYEEYFEQLDNGRFVPIFVPVLEHRFRDDTLRTIRLSAERFAFAGGSEATARQIATNNPAKKYGGMIFTSQRAVEAFGGVVAKLDPAKKAALFDKNMPFYVVGPATARGLHALDLPCQIIGEETGNGETLAKFILEHHNALPQDTTHVNGRKLPLLFMVGEQRRDIIPSTLQSDALPAGEQIKVTEIIVYETGEMATFEEDFAVRIAAGKGAEKWIVVFSPQGCEAMLGALGWLEENGKFSMARRESRGQTDTHIVTIGPTTWEYLVQQFGFEPDFCAPSPDPKGIGAAIESLRG